MQRVDRHDGLPLLVRVIIALLLSVLYTVFFIIVSGLIKGIPEVIVLGLVLGPLFGLLPIGLAVTLLTIRIHIRSVILWCFVMPSVAVAIAGWLGFKPMHPGVWLGSFAIGTGVALLLSPRYKTYRYATCPGCKYDLTLLPKSDVCPECGRDNGDLVAAFADMDTLNKRA